MLKKLRVKKINAASHGVVDVSERWDCVRIYAPAGMYRTIFCMSYNGLIVLSFARVRPPWVEPSRFLARWTLQPKVLEKLYTFEEHQQRNVLTIQNGGYDLE